MMKHSNDATRSTPTYFIPWDKFYSGAIELQSHSFLQFLNFPAQVAFFFLRLRLLQPFLQTNQDHLFPVFPAGVWWCRFVPVHEKSDKLIYTAIEEIPGEKTEEKCAATHQQAIASVC